MAPRPLAQRHHDDPRAAVADVLNAALSGLPAGTKIHYRAVASSDFASIAGADQTFMTASPPTPPAGNVPPKATIVSVSHVVSLHRLGKGKLLRLKLALSEPAKVTIQLVRTQKKVVRSLTSPARRRVRSPHCCR